MSTKMSESEQKAFEEWSATQSSMAMHSDGTAQSAFVAGAAWQKARDLTIIQTAWDDLDSQDEAGTALCVNLCRRIEPTALDAKEEK